jgi:hypothetical protein
MQIKTSVNSLFLHHNLDQFGMNMRASDGDLAVARPMTAGYDADGANYN